MEPLSYYQNALKAEGLDPSPVDHLVSAIASAKPQDRAALFANLEEQANLLSWPRDRDYAAVALHVAALSVSDSDLQRYMLSVAMSRATWCASCATSGGEGICRSTHIRELEALLPNSSFKADGFAAA